MCDLKSDSFPEIVEMTEEKAMEGLANFAKKIFGSQQELPEEFKKILNENWWELLKDE